MDQDRIKLSIRVLLLIAAVVITTLGQQPSTTGLTIKGDGDYPAPREGKLASKLMAREMPYRVVLPEGYSKNSTDRFPVVFLLHGLTGHYNNWTDRTKLTSYAQKHRFIIVTPEGNDGWYTDSVSTPNDKYESYIIQELIPEIDKSYRTLADRKNRAIAGLSMGGYGGLKFGLK
ncbi:MAG: alpha/beta hydrolase-fold protein [Pyrinomonadaceae bacterium]